MLLEFVACLIAALPQDSVGAGGGLPRIELEQAGQRITQSCVLVFPEAPLPDDEGTGAVRIEGDDLRIVCEGVLRGAQPDVDADRFDGVGLHLTGSDIEVTGAHVEGYRVGILAERVDGAILSQLDVSGNFRQRLKSTWEREASDDWLWPHENDEGQWLANYGAGLAVRDSAGVALSQVFVREGQNGIVLERVVDSTVRRCDASFLSGWGLAMWRSSRNHVEGNRFDYCIRGYSHGRYNRGQDSAGILLFEQCSENQFTWNSVTHGGDGVFGFAGEDALGEVGGSEESVQRHYGLGCNANLFRDNDLSLAAAHGLELTFSFDNLIERNWMEGNAICGVWLGYGRRSRIVSNMILSNGDSGYGLERGGINAEHAQGISVLGNRIEDNSIGVRFWSDVDEHLSGRAWIRANGNGARYNILGGNQFVGSGPWLHLTLAGYTNLYGPIDEDQIEIDELSVVHESGLEHSPVDDLPAPWSDRYELQRQIECRLQGLDPDGPANVPELVLHGRERIVVGPWGPIDFESAYLQPLERGTGTHSWRLLGTAGFDSVKRLHGDVALERTPSMPGAMAAAHLSVRPRRGTTSSSYAIEVVIDGERQVLEGWLCAFDWSAIAFPYTFDPREDEAAWRVEALGEEAVTARLDDLKLAFSGGPGRGLGFSGDLPGDHFGVLASCEVELPPGQFLLRTLSDDGVRVRVDGRVVIERWDHHGATEDGALLEVEEAGPVRIEVEYFELDGAAVLEFELRPL